MVINYTLMVLLVVLLIITIALKYILDIKNKTILHKKFIDFMFLLAIPLVSLSLQIVFSNTSIPPIYFDYATYIFTQFGPINLFMIAILFLNNKMNIKKWRFLYVIPTIALIFLWTNDLHHLFYRTYSTELNDTTFGIVGNINNIYGYLILLISIYIMAKASIERSGFFSKQSILIILGIIAPLVTNILGILRVINISIYITPILFSFSALCFYLAVFKLKALNIVPIALRNIMDIMSDGFVVIAKDGTIADRNKTFDNIFIALFKNTTTTEEDNIYDLIKENKIKALANLREDIRKVEISKKITTHEYNIIINRKNKCFETDIQPVLSPRRKEYIGTLLLFKDITQHKEDIDIIEEKQDIIVKQAQLASIGELAGGVAHDINTPISAIKSGLLMFREMLGDRTPEEMEILQRMDNCSDKIITIVNSMRNQIRNLGGNTNVEFKIIDVINDIKTLTYNEIAKHSCELIIKVEDDLNVKGDPTKLGQVLTNLVINAVQAYNNDAHGKIEVTLTKAPNNMAMIKVIDYAGGMDENIKPYIFKNILTTKGTIGTGLGLYLAYSVIKGEFGGNITFESEKGVGTTFYVTIPRA